MVTATKPSWISKKPGRCGGEACVRDTRIAVWVLVNRHRLGRTDESILEGLPDLTPLDLEEAWRYAAENPREIDEAIRRNVEA